MPDVQSVPLHQGSTTISIEVVPGVVYLVKPSQASTSVATLQDRFCRTFAIMNGECVFKANSSNAGLQPLQQEDLITPGSRLHASFTPSIAFRIWNSFRTCHLSVDSVTVSLICSALSAQMAQFIQTFRNETAFTVFKPVDPTASMATCAAGYQECIKFIMQAILQPSSVLSLQCQPGQKPQFAHAASQPSARCNKDDTTALCSLAMVVQLIRMLRSIQHHDPCVQEALQVLWLVLKAIAKDLPAQANMQSRHASTMHTDKAIILSLREHASTVLAETCLWMLSRLSIRTHPLACNDTETCLTLLTHLVNEPDVQDQVSCRLLELGAMPVLIGLLGIQSTATVAVRLMHVLLFAGKLKPAQAQKAEHELLSFEADYSLCNLLCPPFPQAPKRLAYKGYIEIQGHRDVFDPKWAPKSVDTSMVQLTADIITWFQERLPRPCIYVPTLTAQIWKKVSAAASQALVALHWQRHCSGVCKGRTEDLALIWQLRTIAQNFLLPYIEVPELDMQQVLRICNNAILYDWDTFEERNGTKPLAMAIVRRLAQDPKHLDKKQNPCLAVMSEDASKGEVLEHIRLCGGCSQCQGPDWKWTSETVAMLFREFCFHAIHSRTRTTAGAIVKALYAALDSTKQCQHLCRGSIFLPPHAGMWGPEKRQMGPNQVAINTAITAFNTDSADQLTAQLNTIACLARICEQEQKHVDDASWRQVHAPETKPWYRYAIEQKTFRRAMDSFATAFKAPTPWSTERCVALTRALHRCHQLQEQLLACHEPSLLTKSPDTLLEALSHVVAHMESTTPILHLRLQLMTACMQFLAAVLQCSRHLVPSRRPFSEELGRVMTDVVKQLPAIDVPVTTGQGLKYPNFGLPAAEGHLWNLRGAWLTNMVYLHEWGGMQQSQSYFGAKAYAVVKSWFSRMLWGPVGVGALLGQENMSQPLLDPLPYYTMFCWQGQAFRVWHAECCRPDAKDAAAMLYCLFRLVSSLVVLHADLKTAKIQMLSKRRAANKAPLADPASTIPRGRDLAVVLAHRIAQTHTTTASYSQSSPCTRYYDWISYACWPGGSYTPTSIQCAVQQTPVLTIQDFGEVCWGMVGLACKLLYDSGTRSRNRFQGFSCQITSFQVSDNQLGVVLNLLGCLGKDAMWQPLLAAISTAWEWTSNPQERLKLKVHLTQDRKLLEEHFQRLQAYFPLQTYTQSPTRATTPHGEATAIEQLLAEEEQQVAKAAAKKAKKQKQKAKKQLQQQQLGEEAEEQKRQQEEQQLNEEAEEQKRQQEEQQLLELEQLQTSQQQQCNTLQAEEDLQQQPPGMLVDSQQQHSDQQQQQQQAHTPLPESDNMLHSTDVHHQFYFDPDQQTIAGPCTPAQISNAASSIGDVLHDLHVKPALFGAAKSLSTNSQAEDELWKHGTYYTASTGDNFLQKLFCCPLTQDIMMHPTIAADGYTYERAAMQIWLTDHSTSPVTGRPLLHRHLAENLVIKNAVSKYEEGFRGQLVQQLQDCF